MSTDKPRWDTLSQDTPIVDEDFLVERPPVVEEIDRVDLQPGAADPMTTFINHPVHPGELLREDVMASLGLDVDAFSELLEIPVSYLDQVMLGQAAISPDLARKLAQAGLSTARAWLAMQDKYDSGRTQLTNTKEPLCQLLELAITDIEQGRTHDLDEALSMLAAHRENSEKSGPS